MQLFYILDGHKPVPCDDVLAWGMWFETADRHVGDDEVAGIRISTVFLGIDHNHGLRDKPILFETMIFGGQLDLEQWRYATWEEAEAGHRAAVETALAVLTN